MIFTKKFINNILDSLLNRYGTFVDPVPNRAKKGWQIVGFNKLIYTKDNSLVYSIDGLWRDRNESFAYLIEEYGLSFIEAKKYLDDLD